MYVASQARPASQISGTILGFVVVEQRLLFQLEGIRGEEAFIYCLSVMRCAYMYVIKSLVCMI
jgi:hypothetical protein